MSTIRSNTIILEKLKEEDKIIDSIRGDSLSIQVDGEMTVAIKGQHTDFDTQNSYNIGLVDLSTLEKVPTIKKAGVYLALIEGLDRITLDIVGTTGKIHWKEIGE